MNLNRNGADMLGLQFGSGEAGKDGGFSHPPQDVTPGEQQASRFTWKTTGRLEHAQQMTGHESPRTTKLYDRTKNEITLSEVGQAAVVIKIFFRV
jgi:hypothetical protein